MTQTALFMLLASMFGILKCCYSENVTIITTTRVWRAGVTDFTLECTGNEEMEWLFGGAAASGQADWAASSQTVGVHHTSTLKKTAELASEDAREYTCAQKVGTDSKTISIAVLEVRVQSAVILKDFNSTSVSCMLDLQPASFRSTAAVGWAWYRQGEIINSNSTGYNLTDLAEDVMSVSLRVDKPDKMTAGSYVCEVAVQGISFNTTADFEMAPVVEDFPKIRAKVEDESSTIECVVYGYPTPIITWYRRPEQGEATPEVVDASEDRITIEANSAGVPGARLTIDELRIVPDRAFFICNATNSLDSDSKEVLLKVKDKLAAVWPFLGICAEVAILCAIIFIFEKRRNKKIEEEKEFETAKQDLMGNESQDHEEGAARDLELRQRPTAKSTSSSTNNA